MIDEEVRARRIGGSEIAAVVGLSPYQAQIDVWRRIVKGERQPQNKAMKRGILLEPVIAQMYEEEMKPRRIVESGTVGHPVWEFACATPDRIAWFDTDMRNVQLKSASQYVAHRWGYRDTYPEEYHCQVQWEMACLDIERTDLAVLIGGDDFRIYPVARDEEVILGLHDAALRFWKDYVLTETPPPIDGSESSRKWLESKFPNNNGVILEASEEAEDLVLLIKSEQTVIDGKILTLERLKNELKAHIGDNDGIQGKGWKVLWRKTKDVERVDWKAVARDLKADPALILKYTTTSPGVRRFLPQWDQ